jgi:hypothetical protein
VKRDLKGWNITKELALDRRVKANNSYGKTLVFSSSFLLSFYVSFFLFFVHHFSSFFVPVFYYFSLFLFGFLFSSPPFVLLWVSSVAYPNLLEIKAFGCCYNVRLLISANKTLIKVPGQFYLRLHQIINLMLYHMSHFLEIYRRLSKWSNEDIRHKKVSEKNLFNLQLSLKS